MSLLVKARRRFAETGGRSVLQIDQNAEVTRRYCDEDVADYVALGGAAPKRGEVPEPMVGALFSYLLGVKLPGEGTNYLKQESEYLGPAHIDEELTARVRITRLRPDKHLVDLETTCHNDQGELICNGRALVYVADVGTLPGGN